MPIEFEDNFVLLKGQLTEQVRKNVVMAALYLVGQVKVTLGTGVRTGKTYKVPGTKRSYTSSSPGEAPAVMLASLISSISYDLVVDTKDEVIARVGTNIKYAARLEFGYTDTDSMGRKYNTEARPFFRPTYLQHREKIIAILNGETP